jgi:hypothetical protein
MTDIQKIGKKLTIGQKETLYYKNGNMKFRYLNAISTYTGNGKFRTIQSGHRGGRGTVSDKTYDLITIIKMLGYKYEAGNDAIRGGVGGNFIKVSNTAVKNILALKQYRPS